MALVTRRIKRGGEETGAAAAAASPSFGSLPLEIHHAIGEYLWIREVVAISGLAKGLVSPYGDRRCRIVIRENGTAADWPAALRMLQRQQCLHGLSIKVPSYVFPTIAVLAGSRVGERLQKLYLYCGSSWALTMLPAEETRGIAALMRKPLALLPGLKLLHIYVKGKGTSRMQLEILLGALARGAAPNVRTLGLFYPEHIEENFRETMLMMLAGALEARRQVEGCKGAAMLHFCFYNGRVAGLMTYPRKLLVALLPTIERIPVMPGKDWEPEVFDALLEFGAPKLRKLKVDNHFAAQELCRLPLLEDVHFQNLDVEMLDAVQAAAAEAGGWDIFLPSLQELRVTFTWDEENEDTLVAAMGQGLMFSGVRKLTLSAEECPIRTGRAVAAAFAAGAFASLTELRLNGFDDGDVGIILSALSASDCASCLSELDISGGEINDADELASLGAAIGAGRFPALSRLQILHTESSGLGLGMVKSFAQALTPVHALPLEYLVLDLNFLEVVDIIALAGALRDGSLGSDLKELCIGFHVSCHASAGAIALADALEAGGQHVQHLKELQFIAVSLSGGDARMFLERALGTCPRLIRVRISSEKLNDADKAALKAVMMERSSHRQAWISIWFGK